jgi:hypothetical protein
MPPPCSPVTSRTISTAPSYIPRVPANWPVRQVHQIARPYLPRACMYSPMASPLRPTPGLPPPGHIRPPPLPPVLPRAIINALTNIQPLTVNWSVRHVPRIASPGHIGTPPRPTFLAQSPKATSKVNWSAPLAYHADLGVPGCPNILYIANQSPCTTI